MQSKGRVKMDTPTISTTPIFDATAKYQMWQGDCLELMKAIPSGSIDAVVTDPPYAYVKRDYGYWTEQQWFEMMIPLVLECKRVLKPMGSAVFILQPNSEHVGTMRPWLWKFMVWCCENWNVIQDVYWWNFNTIPTEHAMPRNGLMRPSVKPIVWVGSPKAYRNQDSILITESDGNRAKRESERLSSVRKYVPSGQSVNAKKIANAAAERGGVTPFNLLPISNSDSQSSAGAFGHGAGTPAALVEWWVRYISKPGDTVLDPFVGSGTTALVAYKLGRKCIGIERDPEYFEIGVKRLADQQALPVQPNFLEMPEAQAVAVTPTVVQEDLFNLI